MIAIADIAALVSPEWSLAAAFAAVGWRLRPRPTRQLPNRRVESDATSPGDGSADRSRSGDASGRTTVTAALRRLGPRLRSRDPVDASQAASWCDGIARCLRSGSTLPAAIVEAPRSPAITATVGPAILRLQRGAATRDIVDQLQREATSPHLVLVATVLRALATHGGPSAEPVDRAASVLRQRAAAEAERISHSAQARLSARVMTFLPVTMLMVVSITSGSVRSALATPIGTATVALGMCCNLVGWWWMRRIIAGGLR